MARAKHASKPAATAHSAKSGRVVTIREAVPRSGKTVKTGAGGIARTGVATVAEMADVIRFDPQTRIALIRQGIPAAAIGSLSLRMGLTKENLLTSLGLSRATISRKERDATRLSKDESERVLGVETLIALAQTMVKQSGEPTGFDAARWVATWLNAPLPALAGATPASYMDTFEGQKLVAELLLMSQSGAYA